MALMNRFLFPFLVAVLGLVLSCSNADPDEEEVDFVVDPLPPPEEPAVDTVVADTLVLDTSVVDSQAVDTVVVDTPIVEPPPAEPVPMVSLVRDSIHENMVRISPDGAIVVLGTNDPSAKASEKPMMRVKLTYDYSLDVHEVTCKDFNIVSHGEDWYSRVNCSSDSVPMVDVTYFDAVLYANARSKAEGYDTAYTYLEKKFDMQDRCINLEGLHFLPEVEGYRLPTEAEWVFAASQGWKAPYSWNDATAGYVLHDVCTMPTDTAWFCDMEGNVKEITNDWLGAFRDTTVVNFVGATASNSLREKVIKGGAISVNYANINLYSRGDVYAFSASSKIYYVGFRLAFGAIPNPGWMNNGGGFVGKLPSVKSSSGFFRDKVETVRAKLAFRNDVSGNLAFVDYHKGFLEVVEIFDNIPVYHPDISPNGSKVAFCTNAEGVSGDSSVYVRNLDATGSGLVKLDVPNASIPRWYVDGSGDTSIVYVDDASDNSSDIDFMRRSTWKVSFMNGKFGMPKKLFDGAYHGGMSTDERFAVTGSKKLRFYRDGIDEVGYNGEQACNASLSRDGSDRVMFLDFGGNTGRSYAGERYGTHERLLVADRAGDLVQTIRSPSGYSFDHTEWSNREDLAVATLVNADGAHEKIVLVDLDDNSVTDLVVGEELWHPCLWVKNRVFAEGTEIKLDSAGMYIDDIFEDGEKAMNAKMRMFWDMRDSFELIAVGSSRTERGFDPKQMSIPSFNFGFIGGDLWSQLYLMYHYVLPHAKNLKYIVFEISPDLMKNARLTESDVIYGQAPGYYYDRNHDFWGNDVPDEFVRIVDENVLYSHDDSVKYVNTLGLLELEANGWGDSPNVMRDTVNDSWEIPRYKDVMDSVTEFIDSTRNMGITFIGAVYPQSPLYVNTGAYSLHGTRRSRAMEMLDYFDSLAYVYPHFILMDENKFGAHDYTDEMAYDFDHMSANGAKRFAARVDSLVRTLSGGN